MNQPANEQDPFDQLSESLANLPVPEGPAPEVKQRLLEMLTHASEESETARLVPFWRGKTMRKIAIAAALVLVVLGFSDFLLPSNGKGAAYAAMLEQLQRINSMSFTTRIVFQEKTRMVVRTLVLSQSQVREEMLEDPENSNTPAAAYVLIHNRQAGKVLTLQPEEKIARLMSFDENAKQSTQVDLIEKFRDMRHDEAEYLGEEMLDGVGTLKYKYDQSDGHYTVWIDPNSQLPVKVVIGNIAGSDAADVKFEMTDFVWNAKLDESLFSLEVPEGYQLEQETRTLADRESQGQEGLAAILGFYVRLNENQFPEEFNVLVYASMTKNLSKPGATDKEQKEHRLQKLAEGLDRPEVLEMDDQQQKELSQQFSRQGAVGAVYLHGLMETQHWHYQGKGIQLGEANKIVAWWYPKGNDAGTAHVLYGDLRIETMPVDQLPTEYGE